MHALHTASPLCAFGSLQKNPGRIQPPGGRRERPGDSDGARGRAAGRGGERTGCALLLLMFPSCVRACVPSPRSRVHAAHPAAGTNWNGIDARTHGWTQQQLLASQPVDLLVKSPPRACMEQS
jgi:hypothetical protein